MNFFSDINNFYLYLILFLICASFLNFFIYWKSGLRTKIFMIILTCLEMIFVIFAVFYFLEYDVFFKKNTPSALLQFSPQSDTLNIVEESFSEKPKTTPASFEKGLYIFQEKFLSLHISNKEKSDFIKAEELFHQENYQLAYETYTKCLNALKKLNVSFGVAIIELRLADIELAQRKIFQAHKKLEAAHKVFQKKHFKYGEAVVLTRVGIFEYLRGNYTVAIKRLNESMEIFSKINYQKGVAACYLYIGRVYFLQDQFEEAYQYYKKAQEIFNKTKSIVVKNRFFLFMAETLVRMDRYKEAFLYIDQAENYHRETRHELIDAHVLLMLGEVNRTIGKHSTAKAYYEKSILLLEKKGSLMLLAKSLYGHAFSSYKCGYFKVAEKSLQRALEILKGMEYTSNLHMMSGYLLKARMSMFTGNIEEAEGFLSDAKIASKNTDHPLKKTRLLRLEGRISLYKNDYKKAKEALFLASNICEKNGFEFQQGVVFVYLGELYLTINEAETSHAYLYKALRIFKKYNQTYWEAKTLAVLSVLEGKTNNYIRAELIAQEALNKANFSGNVLSEGKAFLSMANIKYQLGSFDESELFLNKAESIFKRINNYRELLSIYGWRAQLARVRGDYEQAKKFSMDIIKGNAKQKNFYAYFDAMIVLGFLDICEGNLSKALSRYKSLSSHIKKNKTPPSALSILINRELGNVHYVLSDYKKSLYYFDQALKIADENNSSYHQAKIYILKSRTLMRVGEFDKSEFYLEKAIHTLKQINATRWLSMGYLYLGQVNRYIGDFEASQYYLTLSSKMLQSKNDKLTYAEALAETAKVHFQKGSINEVFNNINHAINIATQIKSKYQLEKFKRYKNDFTVSQTCHPEEFKFLEESLLAAKKYQDKDGVALAYTALGKYTLKKNDFKEALQHFNQSYKVFSESNSITGICYTLINIGNVYLFKGDLKLAKQYYLKGLDLSRKISNQPIEGTFLRRLGELSFKEKHYEEAVTYLEESLALAKRCGDLRSEARTRRHLALARAEMLDEYTIPKSTLFKALTFFKENNDYLLISDTLVKLGTLEERFENLNDAISCYQEALEISYKFGCFPLTTSILMKLSTALKKNNQVKEAEKILLKAKNILEKNSTLHAYSKTLEQALAGL